MTTVRNDGKSFISYAAACERYGLTRKALRDLVRRHRLTTFRPVTADRHHYLRREALDAIPDLGCSVTPLGASEEVSLVASPP